MQKTKTTVKKNGTGGKSINYKGSNPIPNTDEDIKKVYAEASEGSAYYVGNPIMEFDDSQATDERL